MRIDQTTIREISTRIDIGDFIGNYVALRKRGRDLVGLCPFHGEKTPSFHVHPDRGFFKCFGCGASGDVFKFVQLSENVPFPEAARILAKRAGVEVEPESPATARIRGEKETIYAANALAAAYFHRTLKLSPEAEKARAYCAGRGLGPATIDAFSLGYSPDRWDGLVNELMENGVDLEVALTAGLVRRGQHGFYDFYRGRLMIPTYATTGEVVAFGGRALDGSEPKYLNTSTTPVYTKGRGLYALERARRAAADAGGLIVVEGYLDCIALHQAGFTNAVAALGTAFTVEQAAELRKYAERVFIAFDADAAGAAAASKSIDVLIAAGCVAFVVQLGAGEDPDTFVRTHGRDAFAERIAGAVPWIQYKLDREIDELHESRLPAALAARSAEKMVRNLPSEEWDRWRVYAANRLGLAPDDLRRSRFIADAGSFAPRAGRATRHIAPAAEVPSIDRDVLEALLDEPSLVEEYRERIPATIFRDERYRAVYERLLDTGSTVTTTADVFAAFADDRNSVDMLVALQKGDRSSKVRFADSASRRAQLDRIVEWLEERCLIARKRELDAAIGRLYESGLPIPDADREELDALVKRLDRSSAKRLGTK